MHPLQEKFQTILPGKEEAGEPWASAASARRPPPNEACNELPPGMDIGDQYQSEQNSMPLSLAGRTDVSDGMQAAALEGGYTKLAMNGSDDQYTGEHVDHFYGDAGGFAERNNYLDRI